MKHTGVILVLGAALALVLATVPIDSAKVGERHHRASNAEWRRLCCAKTPETNIAECVGAGPDAPTADRFRAAF